jgi:hypothetical protein
MEMIGQTTADLGAKIAREMKEVERVASTSRNLKGTFVRRLRQASRKAQAAGAELQLCDRRLWGSYQQQRDGEREKEEIEGENARLRERVVVS